MGNFAFKPLFNEIEFFNKHQWKIKKILKKIQKSFLVFKQIKTYKNKSINGIVGY